MKAGVIKSISFSQDEILQSIITLHAPAGIEMDVCYGRGNFYKQIAAPRLKFDLTPQSPDVVQSSAAHLPVDSGSIQSVMFDPPFIITDHKTSEHYIMHKRFTGFRVLSDLRTMYTESITEIHRVLASGGKLIVKCQDQTHGKVNYFLHNEVIDHANKMGFRNRDLFILLAKARFNGKVHKQRTARKYHSYFIVFEKKKRPAR